MRSPMDIAKTMLGRGEVPDRATVQEYLRNGGANLDPVTTAWCAAFVNSSLKQAGLPVTGSNMARSFLNYGDEVKQPQPGDIGVLPRGDPKGPFGHVGFVSSIDPAAGTVTLLAGNQGNAVSEKAYPLGNFLGFRRPPSAGGGISSAPLPDVLSPEAADFVRNNPQPGGYGEGIERMVFGPANPASNPPGILPPGQTGRGILANAGNWFGGTKQDADAVNSLLSGDQKSPIQRLGEALKELGRNQPSGARPPAFPGGPTQAQATGLLELLGSPTMGSILSKRRTQGILS